MKFPRGLIEIFLLVCFAFLTRLPQLLSPHLVLDPDECVVALMAKYMYEGKEFALFFWGQNYGFSLVECLFILPFYALFGITTISVKLGMLSLWTIGIVLFYKAASAINRRFPRLAFMLTVLLISLPAWAIWSMKARGGYLTSFTLSSIILYLLFSKERTVLLYLFIGLLTELVFESQMFWLSGVGPIICYCLIKDRSVKHAGVFMASFSIFFLLFYTYKKAFLQQFHPAPFIPPFSELDYYFSRLPEYLFNSLHGRYYFSFYEKPDLFSALCGYIYAGLIYILFLAGIYHIIFKRKGNLLFIFAVIHIPLIFFYSIFSSSVEGRYLLPITGFSLFALQVFLRSVKKPRAAYYSLCVMSAAGVISLTTFWNFNGHKQGKITGVNRLIDFLASKGVRHVYSTDAAFPYQLIFYSNERIISRMPYKPGRYPAFKEQVDQAYFAGKPVALVGYIGDFYGLDLGAWEKVEDYYVVLNPPKETIAQLFQF